MADDSDSGSMVEHTPSKIQAGSMFFGEENSRLFGHLHQADAKGDTVSPGVVISSPFGHEYMKSHRALRQLAVRLARRGRHCLRFDYRGCGDSLGGLDDVDLASWRLDLETARSELARLTDSEEITVVGVGIGATLAMQLGVDSSPWDRIVVWDPVLSGIDYLADLEEIQERTSSRSEARFEPAPDDDQQLEVLGFTIGGRLFADIKDIELSRSPKSPCAEMLIVETTNRPRVDDFVTHLTGLGANCELVRLSSSDDMDDDPFKPRVPQPVLQAILDWIVGEDE